MFKRATVYYSNKWDLTSLLAWAMVRPSAGVLHREGFDIELAMKYHSLKLRGQSNKT